MIKAVYETVCKTSDKIIAQGQIIESFAFFVKDNDSVTIPLKVTPGTQERVANEIKSAAIKKGVDGYILVLNISKIGKKKKEKGECCVRVLYTRDEKVAEIVHYNDKKILNKEKIEGRGIVLDTWDAWNVK
jgi:hypothetical protein